MVVAARAPGKLVVLGEYAVLDGAPALVVAVDRYARATIAPSATDRCRLTTHAPEKNERSFSLSEPSGATLIDVVTAAAPAARPWCATVDSRSFFGAGMKLGLGSSAAVLCAFAGAWAAARGGPAPQVAELIALHRAFQGGRGSGLDVAASYVGGAIEYRAVSSTMPRISSVRLPNSVGFAGIFAGRSASTPELVGRYRTWLAANPGPGRALVRRLGATAEAGCAAVSGDDAAAFVEAVAEYGGALQNLGVAIGAEIVTAEHRRIGEHAQRYGVAYKVSGAGGGDLGLACAIDADALQAFKRSVQLLGFSVIDVEVAPGGLAVEPRVEERAQ